MESIITPGNITFTIGMLGVIFSVFFYFRKPQEEMETKQALTEKDISSKATILAQKELETKALLLAEQVKGKNEENERRFLEMGKRLEDAFLLAANHTHEIVNKVEGLTLLVSEMSNQITKLTTIIDERTNKKGI